MNNRMPQYRTKNQTIKMSMWKMESPAVLSSLSSMTRCLSLLKIFRLFFQHMTASADSNVTLSVKESCPSISTKATHAAVINWDEKFSHASWWARSQTLSILENYWKRLNVSEWYLEKYQSRRTDLRLLTDPVRLMDSFRNLEKAKHGRPFFR